MLLETRFQGNLSDQIFTSGKRHAFAKIEDKQGDKKNALGHL